ncbi:MAG: hypothetical protein GYB65_03665 [Chloroflexi bacterium]|nr:hypothetical protein [Chloroflexota bacterium]
MIKRLVMAALVMVLVIGGVSFGTADAGGSTTYIAGINDMGCILEAKFYTNLPGTYYVELWDDGMFYDYGQVDVTTAGIYSVNLVLPQPAQDTLYPGVGIYLMYMGDPFPVAEIDPYHPKNDSACGAGEDMVPIPSYAVGGQIVYDTDVYWGPAADQITDPLVTLEAGTTVWVYGPDETGAYYRIMFAGQMLWVPAGALSPNYDDVWQGTPLPSNIQS